jgi:hypothetical protein
LRHRADFVGILLDGRGLRLAALSCGRLPKASHRQTRNSFAYVSIPGRLFRRASSRLVSFNRQTDPKGWFFTLKDGFCMAADEGHPADKWILRPESTLIRRFLGLGMKRFARLNHYLIGRVPERMVTDQQSELKGPTRKTPAHTSAAPTVSASRTNLQAIAAGLRYLMSKRQGQGWNSPGGDSEVWKTAYVLARLGEIPHDHNDHPAALRQQIAASLDWLLECQTPGGGWSMARGGTWDDAGSTAWAVVALRQHGRQASDSALEFIRRCRRPDGAFVSHPEAMHSGPGAGSALPETTASAIRASGHADRTSTRFLELELRTMQERTLVPRLLVCSTILDWEAGVAPSSLVSEVRQFIHNHSGESPLEQALVLRCLVRLRMQRSWSATVSLRRAQQTDGSWLCAPSTSSIGVPLEGVPLESQGQSALNKDSVLATVTALSALAVGELQPGLYFGSDLPFRRLEGS